MDGPHGGVGPVGPWPDAETIKAHTEEIYGPRSALDLNYTLLGPGRSAVPHNMPDAITGCADHEHLINGFDGAIAYWDHHFGRLLAVLEELGIAEETAVIVSADHGMYAEHGLATEPVQRVPLVFYWPGLTDDLPDEARRNDALLYNIDLAPTLCDLLGLSVPPGWQGESFAAAVRGEPLGSRPYLVLGHSAHTYQRAVRTRDHLYIRTYHPGSFRAEWEQLFDVTYDPHLTRDLLDDEPDLAARMRSHLAEWWNEHAGRPGCLPDPMLTTLQTGPVYYSDPAEYAAHLRRTGRDRLADDLEGRLASLHTPISWHAPEPRPTARFIDGWIRAFQRTAEERTH